jgi:hypothetical protein
MFLSRRSADGHKRLAAGVRRTSINQNQGESARRIAKKHVIWRDKVDPEKPTK